MLLFTMYKIRPNKKVRYNNFTFYRFKICIKLECNPSLIKNFNSQSISDIIVNYNTCWDIAKLVRHQILTLESVGSSPTIPAIFYVRN